MQRHAPLFTLAMMLVMAAVARADNPLDDLPSPEGPHVAKIRAMVDGEWLPLGAPQADPDWGSARGRTWTSKMPFAKDLRGAFLFGEGVHGWWNRETNRYMDDLWFYDIRAHRWICLHPGTKVPGDDLRLNENGFEIGPSGHPTPVASVAHGYGQTTYDSDRGLFMAMPCPGEYWRPALSARVERVENDQLNETHASPWIYDTRAGHWTRHRTEEPRPRSGFGDTLIYVPSLGKSWFRHNAGGQAQVSLYDPEKHSWENVDTDGPLPPFGIDANDCYDPKRERIYLGGGAYPVAGGNALWIYDLKTHTWSDPQPSGAPGVDGEHYGTQQALMHYDTANDVVVLIRHGGPDVAQGVHVYDPKTNAWTTVSSELPDFGGRDAVSGFYDESLNVHFLFAAGDSRDNGRVWAYRYRR